MAGKYMLKGWSNFIVDHFFLGRNGALGMFFKGGHS